MSIKKIKAQSPDPYVGKIAGDTEFARLAHLNNLVDQINAQAPPPTPSTNIYNSNGTLTGNRQLNGGNNELNFVNLAQFYGTNNATYQFKFDQNGVLLYDGVGEIRIDRNSDTTFIGMPGLPNRYGIIVDNANPLIKTIYQNNDIGLKLDFANDEYYLGQQPYSVLGSHAGLRIDKNNGNVLLSTIENIIVNDDGTGNYTNFRTQFNLITTEHLGNDTGLKLDFATSTYQFGQLTGGNSTYLEIDDNSQLVTLNNKGQKKGFYFDFTGNNVNLGIGDPYSIFNGTTLGIDDGAKALRFSSNSGYSLECRLNFGELYLYDPILSGNNGIDININSKLYKFGQLIGGNRNYIYIDDNGNFIKIYNNNLENGLELNFGLNHFKFGKYNGLNKNYLFVNSGSTSIETYINDIRQGIDLSDGLVNIGDTGGVNNNTLLQIVDSSNLIRTYNSTDPNGIILNFGMQKYQLGQINGGNKTQLIIDDAGEFAYFDNNNDGGNGLFLDYATKRFYFGEFAGGGNNTHIKIDDAAAYPVEIFGANISSGTAGAASGQFLKIKVGGVDYKIALLNP